LSFGEGYLAGRGSGFGLGIYGHAPHREDVRALGPYHRGRDHGRRQKKRSQTAATSADAVSKAHYKPPEMKYFLRRRQDIV
jgi:hypothetical protein